MGKRLYFNAFHMNCVVHQSPGLWGTPTVKWTATRISTLGQSSPKLLEQGKFDGLFLADVIGVYDVFRRQPDVAVRGGCRSR